MSLVQGDARPPPSAERIEWWDRLRIVAFLDIAGFHLHLQHPLWGIGLPTFLLMAVLLASRRAPPQDTATFVRARAERLLIPWAFWSVVFGMYLVLSALRHDVDLGVFAVLALLLSTQMEVQSSLDVLRRYVISLAAIVGCLYLPALAEDRSRQIEKLLLAMNILHVPIQHQIILRLETAASFQMPPAVGIAMVAALSVAAAWALRLTALRRFL